MRHAPATAVASPSRRAPRALRALLPALLGVGLLAAAPAPAPSPPPAAPRAAAAPAARPTPRYEENVEVTETSVLAAPPAGAGALKAPGDWLVRENGADRRVERVEGVSDEPWEILVWVDAALCRQESLARTTVAVARQAVPLVKIGSVRVVVADPEPRTVLAPTREAGAVVDALAKVAAEQALCKREPDAILSRARGYGAPPRQAAGLTIERGIPRPTKDGAAAGLRELRALVDQRTELLARTAGRCPAATCALFYVGEGYPLDPDLELPAEVRPAEGRDLARAMAGATEALARQLALGHWMLVALPFAPPPPPDEPTEAEKPIPKEARPGPEPFPREGDYAPPGAPRAGGKRGLSPPGAPPASAIDVYTETQLAPLRRIAERTAGDVLRVPDQLPHALDALRDRRWIWYRTAPFAPGEVRTLEVLAGKPLRKASAPAWVGAPAPR